MDPIGLVLKSEGEVESAEQAGGVRNSRLSDFRWFSADF